MILSNYLQFYNGKSCNPENFIYLYVVTVYCVLNILNRTDAASPPGGNTFDEGPRFCRCSGDSYSSRCKTRCGMY